MIAAMRASSRPMRLPSYMSRTIGARQHARARAAQRLNEARGDQRLDGKRQRAGQRRHQIDAERGDQHRPPAVAIRQRPVEHLRAGKPDQIGRDRQLHLRRRRIEQAADRRQRRQIHVDRQRAEPGQHGEQQRRGRRAGTQHCRAATGRCPACRSGAGRCRGCRAKPWRDRRPSRRRSTSRQNRGEWFISIRCATSWTAR